QDALSSLEFDLDINAESLILGYHFITLREFEKDKAEFRSKITFVFHETYFSVESPNKHFEKIYTENLSDEEIRVIVEDDMRYHLDYIESRISELGSD
ncbi:MAG: hypothetical protein AAGC85_25935, partial [Bacteroidota bacterium]